MIWAYFEKAWPFRPVEIRETFIDGEAQSSTLGAEVETPSAN
jgi:hypothetical protein